jgi:hypothetical protein
MLQWHNNHHKLTLQRLGGLVFEYVNILKEMSHPMILFPFTGCNWAGVLFLNNFFLWILNIVFFLSICLISFLLFSWFW